MGHRQSGEASATKYYVRATKRIIKLITWLFVLFLIVMGVMFVAPKVWHFVFG